MANQQHFRFPTTPQSMNMSQLSDEIYTYQQQNLFGDSSSMLLVEPEAWFAANKNNFDAQQFLQFIENYYQLAVEKGSQMTLQLLCDIMRELCDKAEQQQIWCLFQGYPYKRHCDLVRLLSENIEAASQQVSDSIASFKSKVNLLEQELDLSERRFSSLEAEH